MGLRVLAMVLALLTLSAPALASTITDIAGRNIGVEAERHALIIGNGAYTGVSQLANTVNDARAVGAALSEVGFDVITALDMDRQGMNDAIGRFLEAVTPGSEALIYYAGHGVELEGENFLLPIDVRPLKPSQRYSLRSDAIGLNQLMEDLQSRQPRVSLVILDACRNNPFPKEATRSLGGETGLSTIEDPPQGTIVIYAAAAGELALDSLGEDDPNPNGLFTRNLLELIQTPGLEIRPMVQELKERVYVSALENAQHTQRPSYYDGLIGKFYFLPPEATAPAVPERNECELLVDPAVRREQLLFLDTGLAVSACREASLRRPEEKLFADLLAAAEEQRAAQRALLSKETIYAEAYLEIYPAGRFADDIKVHLASLQPAVSVPQPEPEPDLLPEPEPEPELDPRQLALLVQTELNRVGCNAGSPDGVWGSKSAAALREFDAHSDIAFAGSEPTAEILEALQGATGRVCPAAQTSSRPATGSSSQPASGCFVFNGETFCE